MASNQKERRNADVGWKRRVIEVASFALLFLSIAYPTVTRLVYLKASLFGVLLFVIVLDHFISGYSCLAPRIVLWALCLTSVGIFFVMEGILAQAPGATSVITIYILWPLSFTLWVAGLSHYRVLVGIDRIALIATLFVGVYGCLYLLTSLRILPDNGFVSALSLGWDSEAFGAHEGHTEIAIAGMNGFPFLLPYVIASIAIETPSEKKQGLRRVFMWLAFIFGCAIVLVAGRRALMLVVILSPGLVFFFRSFQPEAEKLLNRRSVVKLCVVLGITMVLLLVGISAIYDFSLTSLLDRFTSAFDIGAHSTEDNEMARYEQLGALWHGWLQHPILGSGHGSGTRTSIRSDTMPWAYELSYLAVLFQTGLVGFTAYLAGVLWIFHEGIKIIREGGNLGRIMVPMLVGFSGLLIANATNPYLLKFDGMWMFFLPLAVINCRLMMPGRGPLMNCRNQSFNLSTSDA